MNVYPFCDFYIFKFQGQWMAVTNAYRRKDRKVFRVRNFPFGMFSTSEKSDREITNAILAARLNGNIDTVEFEELRNIVP